MCPTHTMPAATAMLARSENVERTKADVTLVVELPIGRADSIER